VPVYKTLSYFPKAMIDNTSGKQSIIETYYTNAALPSAAYIEGTPSALTSCHDLWANPHGDPTWTTHSWLYNYVTVNKSYIWSQCHAVSVLEGTVNSSSPYQQLNFLTTSGMKCYSAGKCGSVAEIHAAAPTSPYTHANASDPIMQFMSTMDGVCSSGSERWYIPVSTGSWRSTTQRLVTTSDGSSPNEGVLMAYGPAYGDGSNGYVMYEGGHDLDGAGTTTEKVAAQRAFFNFVLLSGINKQPLSAAYNLPSYMWPSQAYSVSVTPSGGCAPYTYSWSNNMGGGFSNANAASTTYYSPPAYANGIIKCTITDCCGRVKIISSILSVSNNPLPISLTAFTVMQADNAVQLDWTTSSEVNNDYFTLLRSTDATHYSELARVKAVGNSTHIIYYSWTDNNPADGDSYYRLTQTDRDGTVKIFQPVHFKSSFAKAEFSLSRAGPVPFTTHLRLQYSLPSAGRVEFILMNTYGQVVRSRQTSSAQGDNEFLFDDLESLPAGLYFLMLRNEAGVTKRLSTLKE
jgi:hypothetical protein